MKKSIILFAFIFVYGCASVSTNITSYTDPDYRTYKVKNIAVIADVADLSSKMKIESTFVHYFREKNIAVLTGYDIIPPTRNYSADEMKAVFKKNGIDAVLVIAVSDAGYKKEQVTIDQPYETKGTIYRTGSNQYQYSSKTDGGPQSYTVKKPHLTIKTSLFDPKAGRMIWIANSYSRGNAFVNLDSTFNNYVNSVVNKLDEDNLLPQVSKVYDNEKQPEQAKTDKLEGKFIPATVNDIPLGVKNQALKEMTIEELNEVIRDMPRSSVKALTLDTVRMIYDYNKNSKK